MQLRNNWATCNEGPRPRPWLCPYMGMAHSMLVHWCLHSAMESSSSGSDHSVNEMATSSEGDASSQSLMSSEISDCSSSEEVGLSSQSEISSSSETDSQCSESNNCSVIHPSVEQPLFPGSDISVFQSHLLLYQFHLKHGLTNEGCMELLTLLKMHMPMSDNLPTSSYTLKQFFAALFPDLISSIHYYCSRCHCYLEKSVSCSRCEGESTVPLQGQIKRKMEGEPIYNYTLFTQCCPLYYDWDDSFVPIAKAQITFSLVSGSGNS